MKITQPQIQLKDADWIMVNSSAGKDSQTALRQTVVACDEQGIPRSKIIVVHAQFDEEWDGTESLAKEQASHYGIEFISVRRRTKDGVEESLLDYVKRRKKWPDNNNRYCTSDFKRGPANRVLTILTKRLNVKRQCKIVSVFGFRSQESPRRKKMQDSWVDQRTSNTKRQVVVWLPIHHWTAQDIWDDIRVSGVPYHWAYDKGMPRLSCQFCIFAPKAALQIAAVENPKMFEKYKQVEREIGHTFRKDLALNDIIQVLPQSAISDAWNM